MSEFIINNPLYVHLLWIVAIVAVVMAVAIVYRRRALARFATTNLHRVLAPQLSSSRRWVKTLLLAGALAAMTAALIDIRWGRTWREVPQRGVDVMFVLDVSHSMLAQDATPNRLERAKQYILDIVREMQGDRVGLVTFAGDTAQKSPLTSNYREFQLMLDEVGPHSVSRGGSDLGRAIEMAARGFIDKSANHKAIVVLSDGEDQDSKPVEVAKSLYEKRGIRIFTVGLGDETKGARIPMRDAEGRQAWLQYEGQDVWTKMNGNVLQEVAMAANGAYVPAGTKHVSMDKVYKQHIASIEQQQYEQARVNTYIPRYQWFVGLALLLAGSEVLLRDMRKVRMPKSVPVNFAVLLTMVALGAAPSSSYAAVASSSPSPLREGQKEVAPISEKQAHSSSLPALPKAEGVESAGNSEPSTAPSAESTYNQAVELYRGGKTDEAASLWSEVAQSGKPELEAKAKFNLGNCSYSAATKLREQQPEQAIQQLDTAIAHYRDSLKLNRTDKDARVNIELAAKFGDQIHREEEQKKQQQKQDQQNQQDQQQKQDQEQNQQQDQQKQDQQKSGDQQKEQNQDQQQNQQPQDQQQKEQKNQQQNQQDKQQNQEQKENEPQQNQDQQSQSQQDKNQKSDSKQDKQQNPEQDQQKQDQQNSSDQQKKQDQNKQEQQQQNPQQQQDPNSQQQKDQQNSSQQDQSKQDQSKEQKESSANSQQDKQPQNQQEKQQQPSQKEEQQPQQQPKDSDSKSAADQHHADQRQPNPKESGEPKQQPQPKEPKQDEAQTDKSTPKSSAKGLEANSDSASSSSTTEAEPTAAEPQDAKAMSKEEAAKMLQAIRDRDLLRRIQQLRKEQSQRRPVEKDW